MPKIDVPAAQIRTVQPGVRGPARQEPDMSPEDAEKIIALYRQKYPEIGIEDSPDGTIYTVPAFPPVYMPKQKDDDRFGDDSTYFHAGDMIAYRTALKLVRKRPIRCRQVAPQKTKRPTFSKPETRLVSAYY